MRRALITRLTSGCGRPIAALTVSVFLFSAAAAWAQDETPKWQASQVPMPEGIINAIDFFARAADGSFSFRVQYSVAYCGPGGLAQGTFEIPRTRFELGANHSFAASGQVTRLNADRGMGLEGDYQIAGRYADDHWLGKIRVHGTRHCVDSQGNRYQMPYDSGDVAFDAKCGGNAPPAAGCWVWGPTPIAANPGDVIDPAIRRLSFSPSTFAALRRGPSVIGAASRGARVTYRISERATARFTIVRARAGQLVGGRCVKRRRGRSPTRACTRFVSVRGGFSHQGRAGANRFRFSGRLRGRKLPAGRYRLVMVATDGAGNRSRAKRTNFRIVRR